MANTAEQALKQLDRLYRLLFKRRPEIEKNDRYYRGEQPLAYASAEWKSFHGDRYRGFSDNWCGVVGNAPAERLRATGFRLPADDTVGSALSDDERTLWDWWSLNELDLQSSQGFLTSIVAKRSFALVWGNDDDEPVVTWEDPAQMYLDVDPEDHRTRRYALKVWIQDGLECATLFGPDTVWKFQRATTAVRVHEGRTPAGLYVPPSSSSTTHVPTGGWQPRQPKSDDTWPLDNPMGVVPVVEFPNRPMLGGRPISDIAGTIAMQDAINLLWAYLFVAADYASMPARVVMGQEPPKVPILGSNGEKIGEKEVAIRDLAQGRLLWLTGQNTKIDQFEKASLDAFTDTIEVQVGHVGAQTRTPPHYLVANKGISNLGGDALKAAETGLVKRVEEEQLFLSPAQRELFRLMALAAGRKDLAEKARRGVPQWKDAESRSEAQLVDALQKLKDIGFPFQWIAERYGLSQTEVVRLVQLKQQEADSDLFGAAAAVVRAQQGGALPVAEPELEPAAATST